MYRPINCLCCLSKVFEKLIFNKLYEHVKGTLHDSQFGFRPQRSAIIQMLCFLDQLYKEVDSIAHDELFVFYLDFQKAFDTVPHHRVVAKLSESGIGGKALRLIANYCDDRKQRVRIGTSTSSLRDVTSGVPQGSILGPLLFLVYINDLPQKIEYSQTYGYADDYKLLSNNKHELQTYLQKLNEWCNNNEMRLHENKCKILCFKKKSLFTIKNETVNISSHQKDLGIQVCDNLTWHQNASTRASKTLKALWYLRRNLHHRTLPQVKLNAYTGYIVPIISYACQVWYPSKCDLVLIERIQKSSTKRIIGSSLTYKERLIKLKILPLSFYFELHSLLLLCDLINNKYNIAIEKFIHFNNNNRTRQGAKGEIKLTKKRLFKSDENFWSRTAYLYNIVNKQTDLTDNKNIKYRISDIYWKFFLEVLTKLTCALGEFAACAKTVTPFRKYLIYNDQQGCFNPCIAEAWTTTTTTTKVPTPLIHMITDRKLPKFKYVSKNLCVNKNIAFNANTSVDEKMLH